LLTANSFRFKISEMKKNLSSKSVILVAFLANLLIALLKLIVSFITRSSAMLAEAVHSFADTINQVLLLIGIKKGKQEPDHMHPFGFSSELYFWSFIVAIILFTAGAIFSIYEGIHKILHPAPLENIQYAFGVLIFSLLVEGFAFSRAFIKVNRERKGQGVFAYLRRSKKSEIMVVFLEDLAAITGLSVAIILLLLQHMTKIMIFDGIASIIIGLILCVVALFLGSEIKSLLIGESADPELVKKIADIFTGDESINNLIYIKSMQLGPHDILISVKAEFNDRLTIKEISNIINSIEKEIRTEYPEVKQIFIEPDIYNKNY